MFFLAALPLGLALLQATSQATSPPDALALLNEVSQRYADAKSYHIEAVQEENSSNELQHSWHKTLLTAVLMPGGRYRYEGRSGFGAAVLVSDGTTQWDYHAYDHLYTQQPAAADASKKKGRVITMQEQPAFEAESLVKETPNGPIA